MSYAAEYRAACSDARKSLCDREIQAHMRHTHAVRYMNGRVYFSGSHTECGTYIGADHGYEVISYTHEMLQADIARLRSTYR